MTRILSSAHWSIPSIS